MWNAGSRMLDLQTSRNYKQFDAVAIIRGKVETRLFVLLQLSPFSIEGMWEPTNLVEDRTSWHAFVNCFLLRVLDESFRRISGNPDELNLDYAHNFDHSVAVRAAEYFAERMSSLLASHDTEQTPCTIVQWIQNWSQNICTKRESFVQEPAVSFSQCFFQRKANNVRKETCILVFIVGSATLRINFDWTVFSVVSNFFNFQKNVEKSLSMRVTPRFNVMPKIFMRRDRGINFWGRES